MDRRPARCRRPRCAPWPRLTCRTVQDVLGRTHKCEPVVVRSHVRVSRRKRSTKTWKTRATAKHKTNGCSKPIRACRCTCLGLARRQQRRCGRAWPLYSWRWRSPCFPDARFVQWSGGHVRAPRPHVRRGRVHPTVTALDTATNERHLTQDPRPVHPRSTRRVPRPAEGPCDASWRARWPSRSRLPCAWRPSVRFPSCSAACGRACKPRCGGSGRRTSSARGRTSLGWRLVVRILSHACAVRRSRTTPSRPSAHVSTRPSHLPFDAFQSNPRASGFDWKALKGRDPRSGRSDRIARGPIRSLPGSTSSDLRHVGRDT